MHVLEYFQQIYVINLPHRRDRYREMAEQLDEIGLSFNSPGVRLFAATRPEEPEGFPNIGARGCFLSHLGVLRDARERKFERILIFEDDLNFAPDFSARIKDIVSALERVDWSVFYGGYAMKIPPQPKGDEILVQPEPPDSIQTAHFIGFRGAAIAEVTEFLETVLTREPGDPKGGPMHVDGAYGWFRYLNPSRITLVSVPRLGYQRSSRTDIHALRWYDQVPGSRQAIGLLRRLRNRTKL
jgi:glycosyl transferase family 25